ncbi:chloride channel protein [Yinghuangia seranimata]|nr:chloride channel protein [Yinghuangia seranimata]MDI2127688.1 chloride channel protein [Yinghuangia seranimata]
MRNLLLSGGYPKILVAALLLGVPIAFASFFFVSFEHWLQNKVWNDLPDAVGYDRAPWWWPLPALLLAGLILAPIVTRMPGRGGHIPVHGLSGGPPIGPREVTSVVLAALATLPLGVVLGPEAPLMGLGSGLALLVLAAARNPGGPKAAALLGTAGSTAAISTILGGPIVAAIMVVEAAGLGGTALTALLLPCLIATGAGAVVFTGFGEWTGLSTGGLSLPSVPPNATPDAGDFLWGIPVAVVIAAVVGGAHRLGLPVARWTAVNTASRTIACAVAAGVCITAYAVVTGRNPEEAALSGQIELGQLAANPHALSVGTLIALVLFKALAWGICLGSLRGGPIFPSLLLGAALGLAFSGLPGFGTTPALALGIATGCVVVTGLPLTSAVLATLLMGSDSSSQAPLIVISAVIGFIATRIAPPPKPTPEPAKTEAPARA